MIEKLACKLGRNDEIPNIELAEYLCQKNDIVGINEIKVDITLLLVYSPFQIYCYKITV